MTKELLHINPNISIKGKVDKIQHFLGEHFFHESGIMYSSWLWDEYELRPFQEQDFEKYSLPKVARECTNSGYYDAEDSPMVSGAFLYSQTLRYESTGDEEAFAYARKAFDSLSIIFDLALQKGNKGFLCKPYDWKYSKHTSPDQYICAFNGLWKFRAIAGYEQKKRIDYMIPLMADWWRKNNYTLNYFGTAWPILPHHSPAMAALNSMAYKITGDELYLYEMKKLLVKAGSWPTWIDRNRREIYYPIGFPTEKNGIRWPENYHGLEYDSSRRKYLLPCFEMGEMWYTAICGDYFMGENEVDAALLKNAISRIYKYSQFGLRKDLLTYYSIQVDLERDIWHILPVPNNREKSLLAASGQKCFGVHSCRIPDIAVIAHHYAPEFSPGALTLAKKMLMKLDTNRLNWITAVDPEYKTKSDLDCMRVLGSDTMPAILTAYWRAKKAGINLE